MGRYLHRLVLERGIDDEGRGGLVLDHDVLHVWVSVPVVRKRGHFLGKSPYVNACLLRLVVINVNGVYPAALVALVLHLRADEDELVVFEGRLIVVVCNVQGAFRKPVLGGDDVKLGRYALPRHVCWHVEDLHVRVAPLQPRWRGERALVIHSWRPLGRAAASQESREDRRANKSHLCSFFLHGRLVLSAVAKT